MLPIRYIGSFQQGRQFTSDSPLAEVWQQVSRYGSIDYLRSSLAPDNASPAQWEEILNFAAVRIRQCIEFRESARGASLLTAPLPLYYSFLNMTRAIVALYQEALPNNRSHGLKTGRAPSIMQASATVCRGTFLDLLRAAAPQAARPSQSMSLQGALARIVELKDDLHPGLSSEVLPVEVVGSARQTVLNVGHDRSAEAFEAEWRSWFPLLPETCDSVGNGYGLRIRDNNTVGSYSKIQDYCSSHLLPSLLLRDDAVWFLERQSSSLAGLPRPAYYLLASFVLGSIVRYSPERLADASATDAGWSLSRFLRHAERFYPQLLLMWLWRGQVYF